MNDAWSKVRLGDVVDPADRWVSPEAGTAYRQLGVRLWGEGAYEREVIDGSGTKYSQLNRVESDDLVVNKIWARNGSVAVVPNGLAGCVVSGEFPTYKPRHDRIVPRWLHWMTKSAWFWHECDKRAQGTSGKNRIKPEQFLAVEVPLPPLAEQRRIVARLDALAAKIEEAKGLRAAARDEYAVAMSGLASQVIEWETSGVAHRTFGEFSPHVTSGPRSWSSRCRAGGAMRFYRAQDIRADGSLEVDDGAYLDPPDTNQGATAQAQPGDLLIVITGATVGRVGLFTDAHEPGYVSQHVAICRLPSSEVNPKFAHWCLKSREGVGQLLGQRYGQGKPGLNLSNLRAISIPVPSMAVQARVVSRLDRIEQKLADAESRVRSSAEHLGSLLPSLLNRAFAGAL